MGSDAFHEVSGGFGSVLEVFSEFHGRSKGPLGFQGISGVFQGWSREFSGVL